ncbi:Exportin-6 [Lunasporangiospora selenospora]|uniref:Exportin-6 n=1 Tax=Lunasporangiospora selenospora TaxID=979761 RepID=A0A9P6G2E3_9FUNG|nr:Exportin-6 [Lunasporangiospora selenospora]
MEALEQLLAELYAPGTSTERKRVIEAHLEGQRLDWEDCRYLLVNARSTYSAWFATTQFQKRILTEWTSLDPHQQHANRTFFMLFLQQHYPGQTSSSAKSSARQGAFNIPSGSDSNSGSISGTGTGNPSYPALVLKKVVQLVVDIALLDWPDRFPDLFTEISNMIQSKDRQALLGWVLLEAITDEFVKTYPAPGTPLHRAHRLLSRTKTHIWQNFRSQTPGILSMIIQHLDQCYNKMLIAPLATDAPAPSPVEHSLWGGGNFGRRTSMATGAQPQSSPLMLANNSFQSSLAGSRSGLGLANNSYVNAGPSPNSFLSQSSHLQEYGQRPGGPSSDPGAAQSFGKSPTTSLRKTLNQYLGGTNDGGVNMSPAVQSGLSALHARQRIGSISELGQLAMRRSSVHAASLMGSRRNSIENGTFVSGNKLDDQSRETCMLALTTLNTLVSCPGLNIREISLSGSLTTVLKFSTLHQTKVVDLGIAALKCLNGLVSRPGFLSANQEIMTNAVRVMAELIHYFNEIQNGIDDIDSDYQKDFMDFVSLFCTMHHLDRAERELGLSASEFLTSFARFTLEKISIEDMETCMTIWKSLLEEMALSVAETEKPLAMQHPLRRIQGVLLDFLQPLLEKFYKMNGAAPQEEAFPEYDGENELDLKELTQLVECFVGTMGEIFTEEVIEKLNPLLHQQLDLYSKLAIADCKTLPITLGILSKIAYTFLQNFDQSREYVSNILIYITRMTKFSLDSYIEANRDASTLGKDGSEITGTITLALLQSVMSFTPWLRHLWKVEYSPESVHSRAPIAKEIYQELAQISCYLIRALLPSSTSSSSPSHQPQSLSNGRIQGTFLGPTSSTCSVLDRKLLLASVTMLGKLSHQGPIPMHVNGQTAYFSLWELESTRQLASSLSQDAMISSAFMGSEFETWDSTNGASEEEMESREGISPSDEFYQLTFVALSNSIIQGATNDQDRKVAALQVHRSLAILSAILCSVKNSSVATRSIVLESLKSVLPLAQEYFEIYREDHELSLDTLVFFRSLIASLSRQVGASYCIEFSRVLLNRMSDPSWLPSYLVYQGNTNGWGHSPQDQQQQQALLQQRAASAHQQKAIGRLRLSVLVLKDILSLTEKSVSNVVPEISQYLLYDLGPKLLGVQSDGQPPAFASNGANAHSGDKGLENGVYDLMSIFLSTIQTLLSQHSNFFFATKIRAHAMAAAIGNGNHAGDDGEARQRHQHAHLLERSMEMLAQALHRPEPDVVRQSIQILMALQEHSLCRLFDRVEFQSRYRFEFLQIVLRVALSRSQDLLLEEMADLLHAMVKGTGAGLGDQGSMDEKFMNVYHGDLKRFIVGLEPCHIAVSMSTETTTALSPSGKGEAVPRLSPSPTGSTPSAGGVAPSTPGTVSTVSVLSDKAKEALWEDLMQLGDATTYREGLYAFVNDAQIYAQSPVGTA